MRTITTKLPRKLPVSPAPVFLTLGATAIAAALIWQGVELAGNPDPTAPDLSRGAVVLDTGLLVFREGLEAILVLAALTASLMGSNRPYRRPVAAGAAAAFAAAVATWFIAVALLDAVSAPALEIQAATGLLAIVVLLLVMNWFFHKIYWTRWISMHTESRRRIMQGARRAGSRPVLGLVLLGFTAIYREGFEVVLFLQNMRLRAGSGVVLEGVAIGLAFTLVVGALTFVAHHRLPYKKMLVLTGIMLAGVLVVMVGESAQELQLAHWISTTPVNLTVPPWMGVWLAVFPTAESLGAQAAALLLVVGSYLLAQYLKVRRPRQRGEAPSRRPESAPA